MSPGQAQAPAAASAHHTASWQTLRNRRRLVTSWTLPGSVGTYLCTTTGSAPQLEGDTALDWCANSGDFIPVDVSDGRDLAVLRRLRQVRGYDLAVVDLPGARVGAFQAILTGDDGRPVADLMVVPTSPELMDLRPVIRVVRGEVAPLGLVHLLVLTRVDPLAMMRAHERQTELRDEYRLAVATAIVRDYVIYREALERSRTVLDIGRAKSYARRAEEDYRALTAEVLALLGISNWQPQEV